MPIVREYTADAAPSGPLQTRQARNADTGEVGNAFSALGESVDKASDAIKKHQAASEITSLTARMSQMHADAIDNLDETLRTADPEDTDTAKKFMQSYDDKMQSVQDNIQTPEGRVFFSRMNSQYRAHLQNSASLGQAKMVGQDAVDSMSSAADASSAAVLKDPSSFDTVLRATQMSVQAQVDNGRLPQNKADELSYQLETQLRKAQVQGMIELDPNGTKQKLQAGKFQGLDSDETLQLTRQADQAINAKRIEQDRLQKVQNDAITEQQDATKNKFLDQLDGNQLDTKSVLHSNLDPSDKEHYLNLIDKRRKQQFQTDPEVANDLFQRIHADINDPNKITDSKVIYAAVGDGLNISAAQKLDKELKLAKSDDTKAEAKAKNDFYSGMKSQFVKANPMLGIADPAGMERFMSFRFAADQAYEDGKKAGKTTRQLLDPQSPDYVGKLAKIYQPSQDQILKEMSRPYVGGSMDIPSNLPTPGSSGNPASAAPTPKKVEPRKPGESISDYRNRTGI